IGSEVLLAPSLLVVARPTCGADARAATQTGAALRTLAADGPGVIVISQDLDELLESAATFAVLAGGRLSATRPAGEVDLESLGRMMGGAFEASTQAEFARAAS